MKKYILLFLILLFAIPVFSQIKVGTITLRDSSGTLVISSGVKSNGTITFYYFNADSILIGGININNGGLTNVAYINRVNTFALEQTFEDDILVTGLIYTQDYISADDSILLGGKNINQFRTLTNVAYLNDSNQFTGLNTFFDNTYLRKEVTIGTVPSPANLNVYGNVISYGYVDAPTINLSGVNINTPGTLTNVAYKSDTNAYMKVQQLKQGTNITMANMVDPTAMDLPNDGNLFVISNFSTDSTDFSVEQIFSTNFTIQEGMIVTFLCLGANDSTSYFKHEAGATTNKIKLKDATDYNVIKHCIISFAYLNDQWWEVYRTEF